MRVASEPLRVSLDQAFWPADNDLALALADVAVSLGDVDFASNSTEFSLLALFDPDARTHVAGRIEPVSAHLKGGTLAIDEFVLTIDDYVMPLSGTVDLLARRVDLRTYVPMTGMGGSIRELRAIAPSIKVPILIHGPYESVKSEIDPDFTLDQVLLEPGLLGGILQAVGDTSDPVLRQLLGLDRPEGAPQADPLGDLFDLLLGGTKNKNPPEEDKSGGEGGGGGGD